MCAPSAPPTPDPYAVSAAQTQSNTEAARLQAQLNRVNTSTPWGSLSYSQDKDNPDTWSANVNLSPDQQKLLDSNNQTALGMNQAGTSLLGQVQSNYANPLDFSKLPNYATGADQGGGLVTNVAAPSLPAGIADAGGIRRDISSGPIQGGVQTFGVQANKSQLPTSVQAGPLQYGVGQTPVQTGISTNGMQGYGAQPQAGKMDFGQGLASQGFTTSTSSSPVQMALNRQNLPGVTQDYSADRAKVEDALYSRINPQLQRDRGMLESRLAAQGITQGSEAYTRATDEANRQANDARMQAILAGGSEQSRLADLALRTRGQLFGEETTAGQFANTAQQQQYSQSLSDAQLENQRNQLAFQQQLDAMQARNQATGQDFGQQLATSQQGNATRGQQVAEELAKMQAGNAASGQQFTQGLQGAQLNNQTQGQAFSQGLAGANLAKEVDAQRFGQDLAASGQNFSQGLAAGQFGNQAEAQRFSQDLAGLNAGNAAQAQQFGQNQAGAQFAQGLAAQQFGMGQANAGLANSAQAQWVQQQLQNAGMQNDVRARMIQEMLQKRNEPLNALSALRSGTQVSMPNFPGSPQTTVAPTNTAGNVWNAYNGQLGAYNAQVGQQNALMQTAGQLGAAYLMMPSDRRLKENIQRIGEHKLGIGVYSYNYIWDKIPHVGVMADEVKEVMPEAVLTMPNGFDAVNYAMIGGV